MSLPANMEGLLRHHLQIFLNTAKHCFPEALEPDSTGQVRVTAAAECGLDGVVKVTPQSIAVVRAPRQNGRWMVKVTLFKGPGKYYTEGTYWTSHADLHDIWTEVRSMVIAGQLPGIHSHPASDGGHTRWNVLINVPGHPHEHPLLIPATRAWE